MHLRRKSKAYLLKQRVHDLTDTLIDKAADLSDTATTLAPKVTTAREAAASAYEQASHRVREDVVPRVRDDYAVRAREVAAPAVTAMLSRKVIEEKPKKHRLRKLLALIGIGGAVAYVANKFRSGGGMSFPKPSSSDSWSTTAAARPTAVRDATASDDGDTAGSDDAAPSFSTEFTTTPPTEATGGESDSASGSKSRKPRSS